MKKGKKQKEYRNNAEIIFNSIGMAGLTIYELRDCRVDEQTFVTSLHKQIELMTSDKWSDQIEIILAAQAQTLDVLFNQLVKRGYDAMCIEPMRACLELSLKAQKQCRQTLVALANLKQPQKTMFVKQQNVAVNQQINGSEQIQPKEKNKNIENELLRRGCNEKLDTGGTKEAITTNIRLDAMEAIHRAKEQSR